MNLKVAEGPRLELPRQTNLQTVERRANPSILVPDKEQKMLQSRAAVEEPMRANNHDRKPFLIPKLRIETGFEYLCAEQLHLI